MKASELIEILGELEPDTEIQVESEDGSITEHVFARSNRRDWIMIDVVFETNDGSH